MFVQNAQKKNTFMSSCFLNWGYKPHQPRMLHPRDVLRPRQQICFTNLGSGPPVCKFHVLMWVSSDIQTWVNWRLQVLHRCECVCSYLCLLFRWQPVQGGYSHSPMYAEKETNCPMEDKNGGIYGSATEVMRAKYQKTFRHNPEHWLFLLITMQSMRPPRQLSRQRDTLTIEVTAELGLFLSIFIQSLNLPFLPLQLSLFLDFQVTVQLGLLHGGQLHLSKRRTASNWVLEYLFHWSILNISFI